MTNDVVLGTAIRNNLLAINRAQSVVDRTSTRLASGLKVNTALDQPQNFFTAKSLDARAGDLSTLLDGINLSIRTLEENLTGINTAKSLLEQAEAIALNSLEVQESGGIDNRIIEVDSNISLAPLSTQILNRNPFAYYRLNDAGNPAFNSGTAGAVLDGTYVGGVTNGAAPLYVNGGGQSTDFGGTTGIVDIPDSAFINTIVHDERTVELVFNADTTAGRQVLYEEGGNNNAINIYIESGEIYFNIYDDGNYGPFTLRTAINAGQTYHAALVYDGPGGELRGYLDGTLVGTRAVGPTLDAHVGDIGIGGLNGNSFMHDGGSPSNTFRFDGRISDVALYNDVLTNAEVLLHANSLNPQATVFVHQDFENTLNAFDDLLLDASFRGVNLLAGDDLRTYFNEDRSNLLRTRGVNFSSESLGIGRFNFNVLGDLRSIIGDLHDAIEEVEEFGQKIANDIAIIKTRQDFTENVINNHLAAADDLTAADLNEEGANQLAAATRLQISQSTLASLRASQTSILQIFNGGFF